MKSDYFDSISPFRCHGFFAFWRLAVKEKTQTCSLPTSERQVESLAQRLEAFCEACCDWLVARIIIYRKHTKSNMNTRNRHA